MKNKTTSFATELLKLSAFVLILSFISHSGYSQGWIQMGETIAGTAPGDLLGYWIVMSSDGNTIAAGAAGNAAIAEDAGAARVFEWNGSGWIQKGNDITGTDVDDELGYSVDLSNDGNILAVGATEDTDDQSKNGYAKVFEWDGSAWVQMGPTMQGENPDDRFGTSVSLSGDGQILAVSSRNGPNGYDCGNVKVFEWSGSDWVQKGSDINGSYENEGCGWALDINDGGDALAVGFPGDGFTTNGIARIYEFSSGDWQQIGADLTGNAPNARFGWVISLNAAGDVVAIGARDYDGGNTDQGQVKVFNRNSNDWELMGNPVTGQAEREFFGWSVDLCADGMTFVAGVTPLVTKAWDAGHARIYEFDGSDWNLKGEQIDGENDGDRSGFTVAINDDASMVVMGAPFADVSAYGEGKMMVYSFGFVDVQEQDFGDVFSVYPNPFINHFSIELGKTYNNITLNICDLKGQQISSTTYHQTDYIKFSEDLPEGIYLIELNTEDGHSAILKLVKGR